MLSLTPRPPAAQRHTLCTTHRIRPEATTDTSSVTQSSPEIDSGGMLLDMYFDLPQFVNLGNVKLWTALLRSLHKEFEREKHSYIDIQSKTFFSYLTALGTAPLFAD